MGDVCKAKYAKYLDNFIRRLIHNPAKMFGEYVKHGNTILDIGCGPGTFTLGLAELAGAEGKVHAVDLQAQMLEMAREKLSRAGILDRVEFHQCSSDSLDINIKADFILTFYMVHETPDPQVFIDQICNHLSSGGYYYIAEPKGHVSKEQFERIVHRCKTNGLSLIKKTGLISRIAILKKN